jgi:iron(III) transport system substrate-binding protein
MSLEITVAVEVNRVLFGCSFAASSSSGDSLSRRRRAWPGAALFAVLCAVFLSCGGRQGETREEKEQAGSRKAPDGKVIVYTALDQLYSEVILKRFEEKTGITVEAVYDSEAAKTTGLVNRLIAEKERPRCDVFWNNEIIRTIRLKEMGLLEKYQPSSAQEIPASFKDLEGYWTGFAARARVLAYNTRNCDPARLPKSITELAAPRWKGRIGMAYPLFGSTSTHAAVLWSEWGEQRARIFFQALKANGVVIFDGNMTAARAVADGEIDLCLTDTDDAHMLRGEGKPIDWVLLDHDGKGALLIPNSVALVRNAPHSKEGRMLIEYLLSPEVEAALASSQSAQIPLRPGVEAPPKVKEMARGPFLGVDFQKAAGQIEPSAGTLKTLFAQP